MNFFQKLFKKTSTLIITARVTKIEKHPNADRLRVITLDAGPKWGTVTPVVCGAFNFSEGDVVALALPGARIAHNIHSEAHESFTLEKATIRGVESQGMICSGFELSLRNTPETREEGILILPKDTSPGLNAEKIAR